MQLIFQILKPTFLNIQLIYQICLFSGNETSSIFSVVTRDNIDMHVNHTKYFVDMSTTRRVIIKRSDGDSVTSNSKNLLQRNWKLITILLLVLSCIVLSFAYCQPTLIRIREIIARLTSSSQS